MYKYISYKRQYVLQFEDSNQQNRPKVIDFIVSYCNLKIILTQQIPYRKVIGSSVSFWCGLFLKNSNTYHKTANRNAIFNDNGKT